MRCDTLGRLNPRQNVLWARTSGDSGRAVVDLAASFTGGASRSPRSRSSLAVPANSGSTGHRVCCDDERSGRSRSHAADDGADAVDPDRAILAEVEGESLRTSRPRQQPAAHRLLGIGGRAPVEPFVEVERERFLDIADVDKPALANRSTSSPPVKFRVWVRSRATSRAA